MSKRKLKLKKKFKKLLFFIIIVVGVIFYINNKKTYSIDVNINTNEIYLIKGEYYKISVDYDNYEISDSNIIEFSNNNIKGLNNGKTALTFKKNNDSKILNIYVTDLLSLPEVDNNKSYLGCHVYNDVEASLIDNTLSFKINNKGYNTRAGAVEAARFLTLMFKYKLKYFYENGRLDRSNSFYDYVDGEGRYYHKGLYLTDNKFNNLIATLRGPQPWGCSMYNDTVKDERPNGLDCSGFVTWALVNAGYDPGDVGAGLGSYNDLTDLGKIVYFTDDNAFENVKVGDLIGRDGHIGMLIGYDGKKYYVAEALDDGDFDLHVYSYTKSELLDSHFKYFVYYDDFYKEDGQLTNMW